MKRKIVSLTTIVLLCCILYSCATIISGTTATVTIDSDIDEPVTVVTSYQTYHDLTLPAEVKVNRRHLDGQHIHLTSPSYAFHDIVLHKIINPWAVGSAMFYGVGLGVDMLTNAVSDPMQKYFFVKPDAPSAKADSIFRIDSLKQDSIREARLKKRLLSDHYKRHEVNVGCGFGANQADQVKDNFVDNYVQKYRLTPDGLCFDIFGDSYLFANVEYHYRLNRQWDMGAIAAWGISGEFYEEENRVYDDLTTCKEGRERCHYFVVAPSVRYTWYETNSQRAYSRLALGLMRHHLRFDYREYPYIAGNIIGDWSDTPSITYIDTSDEVKWRMAWQLTALGYSFGNDRSRCFLELGYGCLGVFRMGVALMF